ncbi:MAG TPA: MFS transporter [Steroidobacteraceae bacterium]|nr:MFS transporter [Steroidobacteraceae bacterium]
MALAIGALVQAVVAGAAWTIMPVLFHEISGPAPTGLGLSLVELGAIWGTFPLAVAFFCIPMGMGADRYGVRLIVGIGVLVAAAAGALRGTSTGFAPLLAWMFLFGVGYSTIGPNLPKMVGMWFRSSELGLANGIILGSYGLGAGLAITFGGSLVSPALGGWRNTLYVLGALSLIIGILWIVAIRDQKTEPLAAPGTTVAQPGLFDSIVAALKCPDVWLLVIVLFTSQGAYIGAIGFLPMYLVEQGLSPATANAYVSILLYVFVAGAIVVPSISDRLGTRRRVFLVSFIVNGLAVMSTAFLTGPALGLSFAIWGFSTGAVILCYVVPLEHPSLGPSLAGAVNGLLMAATFTGGFVSPIVGNVIAQEAGGSTAIVMWGGLYVLAAFVFLRISETHPNAAAKDQRG